MFHRSTVADPGEGGGGSLERPSLLPTFKYLHETKLFHFHRIYKKKKSAKRAPPLCTYEPPFQKSLVRPCSTAFVTISVDGAQWLSGRVLDSKPRGRGCEPHRRLCAVVLEQDTFILAKYWFNPGRPVPV